MTVIEAVIIAIVEGLTEYLPVSSTGHMIIAQSLLKVPSDDFTKAFLINIQFGAILSVVALYWKRFFQSLNFYYKLFAAFLPAAVLGFLLNDFIDSMLESVTVVAAMLVIGGIFLLFVDKWFLKSESNPNQNIDFPKAIKIGFFQCIAMIPGVSRSAATIVGGMSQGLSRKTAAEFSFFLAVPTMFAASAYKLLKNHEAITSETLPILLIGNLVAFLVGIIAIKSFIGFLQKYGFKAFGYYRIILGLVILVLLAMGKELSIV